MSTDITATESPSGPSLLFSTNQPPQSTPVSSVHDSKRSRTSARSSSKAKPQATNAHTVAVVSVNNTIRHLGDQLSTTFMDPLIAVQTATQMLYKDAEILPHHRAFMTRQFSGISNAAAVFISLPDEQARRAYVVDMYNSAQEGMGRST
ncbi:hypothetical protein M404DRAFT_118439 [Pisolithus tinctorius Marx 270]|uniref:Uncharacterized protein n=1 Tax=Pisolithus tinctorius Marx 270 TaxID=870435 RepID=A0A0C3PYU7_PISTI|nr:hypothetical protein M404DRAFT_118439 [Pisolithus tinctorius Marx 270]